MRAINICGDLFYLKDGNLHREDGPAIEFEDGVYWWMQKGKLHRDNGPAIIGKKEVVRYWLNGEPATEEEIKNIKRNKWIDKVL
jgi:hypothetical protein